MDQLMDCMCQLMDGSIASRQLRKCTARRQQPRGLCAPGSGRATARRAAGGPSSRRSPRPRWRTPSPAGASRCRGFAARRRRGNAPHASCQPLPSPVPFPISSAGRSRAAREKTTGQRAKRSRALWETYRGGGGRHPRRLCVDMEPEERAAAQLGRHRAPRRIPAL